MSKAIDKAARGVPQGSADPTSPNHGKYRTTTTEGKRWHGDSGQGYGAGGSRFRGWSGKRSATGDRAATMAPEAEAWKGGQALKPGFEPVVVARKPLAGTVAANVLACGTERPPHRRLPSETRRRPNGGGYSGELRRRSRHEPAPAPGPAMHGSIGARSDEQPPGRWPANVVLDEDMAGVLDEQSGVQSDGVAVNRNRDGNNKASWYGTPKQAGPDVGYGGQGRRVPVLQRRQGPQAGTARG